MASCIFIQIYASLRMIQGVEEVKQNCLVYRYPEPLKFYYLQRNANKLKYIRVLCWIEYALMVFIIISMLFTEKWIEIPNYVKPEKRTEFLKSYKWSFVMNGVICGVLDFLIRYLLIETLYQNFLNGNQSRIAVWKMVTNMWTFD